MSKKSKKTKRKKLISSSSDEDEKTSKEHHKSHSKSEARCLQKQEHCASLTVKDGTQSTRQIKKPVYRLKNTEASGYKPVHKEEECSKRKCSSVPLHGDNCWSNAKAAAVKKGPSNPLSTKNAAGALPLRKKATSESSLDGKSSQRSPSRLKKQQMRPSLVSGERAEQTQNVMKRKHQRYEPPRTANSLHPIKTTEPSKSSAISKDSLSDKRKELVKQRQQQRHQEKNMKAKKIPPRTKQSSTAKYTTSKSSSDVSKNPTSVSENFALVSHKKPKLSSTQQKICTAVQSQSSNFKIPKKLQVRPVKDSDGDSTKRHGTELSYPQTSPNNTKRDAVQHSTYSLHVPPHLKSKSKDKRSSLTSQLPDVCDPDLLPWHDQMQVAEEFRLARSEKRLEMNVMQSCGELTCMDIDPPEEGATDTQYEQQPQPNLILVLDTNILLSHMDYVKKIVSCGFGALGFPVVLIPWVVLQELDSLKKGRGLSGSVAHMAIPAISYIYNSLKNREPRLWGQSMQHAAESRNSLNAENNDDRVLQCCLQYRSLYPECALILCTNDKNLCSKALLCGVNALSKNDLEAEVARSSHGLPFLQNIQIPMLPHTSTILSSPVPSRSCTAVEPLSQERTGLSVGKDTKQLSKVVDEDERNLSSCVSELENCLQEVLSDVLEVEMKAAFQDFWQEIVYLKPPWSLQDVLQCLKKHWIAVFGQIVPRKKLQTVLNLIEFFYSGKTLDRGATLMALQESKDLLKVFGRSSSRVPSAISVVDNISCKLQTQGESPACNVAMNDDDDEDKQPTSTQVSHQEVWTLFENIWSNMCQISFEVFKALGFDPCTMQSVQPVGGPPPPQDALACLQKLCCMVSQLLQALSSVLSSAPGLLEVQTLLSIIQSSEIVDVNTLTAKDLLDCFSQQEYREKLRIGGTQLMDMKNALDRCVEFTGQHVANTK